MSKNKEVLEDFVIYCMNHPEMRFWQALRNWAGVGFILTASNLSIDHGPDGLKNEWIGLKDTFYKE